MVERDVAETISERVSLVKRNCTMCKGRSRLRSIEGERSKSRNGLKSLIELFQQNFNELRRHDADAQEINKAIENKRLCMDLLEECDSCSQEVDLVNRGLNKIRV